MELLVKLNISLTVFE